MRIPELDEEENPAKIREDLMNKETEDDLEAKRQRKLAKERKNEIEQKYKHIIDKQ